jgi:hypothetical protein|tara:strand:+ start:747 stop:1028 length:282 start_codon:yes stop_codon:yes gene_type:complete
MGVTTKKNINPIIKGEIIFPKNIPNLYHNLLNGFSSEEFANPKTKKIIAIIKGQYLISLFPNRGHKLINKKTTKKTIPKFLLEGNFTFWLIKN